MSATLFDVCRRSGVSTATVSRVVNGSPLVHERTRRKVLAAIEELGYRPSRAARTLARQQTDTLGVIFPEIESGFYTEVLRGIDDVAADHAFHLMTAFSHGRDDEQELVNRFLRESMVDGLILLNLVLPNEFVRRAGQGGLPVVLVDRPVAGANLFSVSLDNAAGAEAALTHLYDEGYRSVAIVTGPDDSYDAEQRLHGCRQAAQRAGTPWSEELVWPAEFTEASGRKVMEDWLEKKGAPPEAVFAHNDDMAVGIWAVLKEHGYGVPEDVALVGFDDIHLARHLGLSTVRVPMREMGRAAAEAAIHQVQSGEATKQRVLDVELVVRASSRKKTHGETRS